MLLTAKEAARALAISPRTLWELTARGELPSLRLPGRGKARSLRYSVADLQSWIDRVKAQQTGQADDGATKADIMSVLGRRDV
jgi:excisionase family DNA binding protein